jgi:hypothetical protein
MNFRKLVEEMMSGGAGSVYGPGVTNTETPFSGPNYAGTDGRNLFGGPPPTVLTRFGTTGGKRRSKKKPKKKKK